MENLVHDLPLPIDFEQREQVCEPVAGPVIEFKPHGAAWVTYIRFTPKSGHCAALDLCQHCLGFAHQFYKRPALRKCLLRIPPVTVLAVSLAAWCSRACAVKPTHGIAPFGRSLAPSFCSLRRRTAPRSVA